MSIQVSNRKCIRHIGFRSLQSSRARNIVAILAISLTTILFTALFTIALTIIHCAEQNDFRKVGGYEHGAFKYLDQEQLDKLRSDPLIREYGVRQFLGSPLQAPFHKSQVEVSWCDENYAGYSFLYPEEGRLPSEGSNEAATDTQVLSLLGIEPVIGTDFTLTFNVDGTEVTRTFTLCGYWEYDEVVRVNQILIPKSTVEEVLTETGTGIFAGNATGTYTLNIMLSSAARIERDMAAILERHGYQMQNPSQTDTYIAIGVNWAYLSSQLSDSSIDFSALLSFLAILLLIVFTGYLIIYNIFQIAVTNDIRFYGLLKTIGATGRQLKRIIFMQAFFLSAIGIPIGLLFGYVLGILLAPVAISTLAIRLYDYSVSPWIFAGSAAFSFFTVAISCRKPGRIAARISPIEAVRYTDASQKKKRNKRRFFICRTQGASILRMACSNLTRNKRKTAVTVLSLSLSIVLLTITVILAGGFDLEKYVRQYMVTDFHISNASYYHNGILWNPENEVPEELISSIEEQDGIVGGRTYGSSATPARFQEFVPESFKRTLYGHYYSEAVLNDVIQNSERKEGLVDLCVQLYGMEPFCLDRLNVIEGDLSKLAKSDRYIAAVYYTDDYGNPIWDTHWAKPGDKVTIRFIDSYEFYNTETGEIYEELPERGPLIDVRFLDYHEMDYEVAALVTVPNSLSYRYGGSGTDYVMPADMFLRDTGSSDILYYAFDAEDTVIPSMEQYLADYTGNINPLLDYESRQTYTMEFQSFVRMYLIMGGILSMIVGLIGVLNFLNAILTSILARRREFAVLQSVGMTGRQLKTMLAIEGELLALISVLCALVLVLAFGSAVSNALCGIYRFFTYRLNLLPVLFTLPVFAALGILLPLITYRFSSGKSIVERLREAE